jgi:hypothetical protein
MSFSLDTYYSKIRSATNVNQLLDLINDLEAAKRDFSDDRSMVRDFDAVIADAKRRMNELR